MDIEKIAKQLSALLQEAVRVAIMSVPGKRGNSFSPSCNIVKSTTVEVDLSSGLIINILVPDYIKYIESGRPAHVSKVPISALNDWAIEHGIPNDNSTLYAIQQSIYNNGIAPRPIYDYINKAIDDTLDKWIPSFESEIVEYFNDRLSDILD